MDDEQVLARLDRIDALAAGRERPPELLTELRGLIRDAEAIARERATDPGSREGVVERPRTPQLGT